jgi:hypothetical protein
MSCVQNYEDVGQSNSVVGVAVASALVSFVPFLVEILLQTMFRNGVAHTSTMYWIASIVCHHETNRHQLPLKFSWSCVTLR